MNIEIGQKFYTADGVPHFVLCINDDKIEATSHCEKLNGDFCYQYIKDFQFSDVVNVEELDVSKARFDSKHPNVRKQVLDGITSALKDYGKAYCFSAEFWHDVYKEIVTKDNLNYKPYISMYDGSGGIFIYR